MSPIAGASITADGFTAITDADGYYVISNVEHGDYTVTVSAVGYLTHSKSTYLHSGVTTTVNFEITIPGMIDGTVTDASTGLPISGASINIDGYATTTNADGYYKIPDILPGDYTVTASATGYLSDSKLAHVDPGVTTTVNFTLSPAGTLSVTTTPVAGEVFVNGTSWGVAPVSKTVAVGTYNVSFGPVTGYYTPDWQIVTVQKGVETAVSGVYQPITGVLKITTTPVSAEVFVDGVSWGMSPQSKVVPIGTYNVSFGDVEGYYTPANQIVTVSENVETIVEGVYEPIPGVKVEKITNPELVTADNPFIVDAIEDASVYLIIYEISDPVTIVIKNVTDPDVDPPPGAWKLLGNYIQIDVTPSNVDVNVIIRIYYTQEQLEALGLDENTLTIHYWDVAQDEWKTTESHVNAEEQYVWINVDHFSLWALMGLPPTPLWNQPQFLVSVVIAVAVIAAVTIMITIRRKKST